MKEIFRNVHGLYSSLGVRCCQ